MYVELEPRADASVRVAGPPTSPLRVEDYRHTLGLADLEDLVVLVVLVVPLCARKHGVVVAADGGAVRVDLAEATHQAVGRGIFDQIVQRAPLALARNHQRAVLSKRALVAHIGDVLPRRPRVGLAAARNGLRPLAVVRDDLVPADDLRHIITDNVQVLELRDLGLLVAIRCGSVEDREEISLVDGVAFSDGHAHELA